MKLSDADEELLMKMREHLETHKGERAMFTTAGVRRLLEIILKLKTELRNMKTRH